MNTDRQKKHDLTESESEYAKIEENELSATADRIIPFNITFVADKIVIATPRQLIELN